MNRSMAVGMLVAVVAFAGGVVRGQVAVTGPDTGIVPSLRVPETEWIKGTVLWMVVDLKNPGPERPLYWIVRGDLPFSRDLFGIDLVDESNGKVAASRDFPDIRRGAGQRGPGPLPHPTMAANGVLTVPLRLNWMDPPVGNYKIQFRWEGQSATAHVVIREPTAEERPFIQDGDKMWHYPFDKKAKDLPSDTPQSIRDAMGMDGLLHQLFTAAKTPHYTVPTDPVARQQFDDTRAIAKSEISQFDAEGLGKDLPEFYKPLVNVLRYEILYDQDHTNEADGLKGLLLKENPGYEWMLYRGAGDGPTIARGRSAL